MNYKLIISLPIIAFGLTACRNEPKYKLGECYMFEYRTAGNSEVQIIQILGVGENKYWSRVHFSKTGWGNHPPEGLEDPIEEIEKNYTVKVLCPN